ncbi:helix-turn-helix domain-containing protein (plasmid) [Kitasatospora griseola]|uniref:helix-turn-helix domain-containing protein n=1 Tax=Kitasatospora griseola TaxID=2064 RepID=UPI003855D094
MSAGPTEDGSAARMPEPKPARTRRRRPKPPPTSYSRIPSSATVELPPGHGAQVFPLPSSTGFVGEAFSMDSLEFMRWAARRYDNDRFVLVVLLTLMGSQEPGGVIEANHGDIAEHLGYSRSHVTRVFHVLEADGALMRVRNGLYQLNPAASLRGGVRKPQKGRKAASGAKAERVEQLDLLHALLEDPNAPEAFKAMAQPGAKLDPRKLKEGEPS